MPDVRMHSVMNDIVSSDGEYPAILRKSDTYSGELDRMDLSKEIRLLIDRYVSEQNAHSRIQERPSGSSNTARRTFCAIVYISPAASGRRPRCSGRFSSLPQWYPILSFAITYLNGQPHLAGSESGTRWGSCPSSGEISLKNTAGRCSPRYVRRNGRTARCFSAGYRPAAAGNPGDSSGWKRR